MSRVLFATVTLFASVSVVGAFEIDRSAMSDAYWNIWTDASGAARTKVVDVE